MTKTNGFSIKDTHLTDIEWINRLIILVLITFAWACKAGMYLVELRPIKIKNHGQDLKCLFRYDLIFIVSLLFSNNRDKFNQCCNFFYTLRICC